MVEDLDQLDVGGTVAGAAAAVQAEIAAGCQLLEYAAHWADLNPGEGLPLEDRFERYGEREVFIAGDGTSDIAEFAVAGCGMEIGMNVYQARALIADGLDLRHRLPCTWKRVQAATVPAKLARQLPRSTRRLTKKQAETVDRRLVGVLATLSPKRLDNRIDAEILRVDRERVERETEAAAKSRHVRIGPPDEHGLCDIWTRMPAGDARRCGGSIGRLADLLMARKDDLPDGVPARGAQSKDEWRSVAAALLVNNPVPAMRLALEDHQPDLFAEQPDEPAKTAAARKTPTIQQIDPTELAPTDTLHVHISTDALNGDHDSIARIEEIGPALLSTVPSWPGEACKVRLQPIIDADGIQPVDRYEMPPRMREAVLARTPASAYPWSSSLNRRNDQDHTIAYDPNGPPGQTGLHNLGPLATPEHRHKTFATVELRQPWPGTYVWRSRFGRVIITNNTGTHDLGTDRFAQTIWAAAIATTPPNPNHGSLLEVIMKAAIAVAA